MRAQDFDTKQRFGFRKYKWMTGLASVLLGTAIVFGANTNQAHAATVDASQTGRDQTVNTSTTDQLKTVSSTAKLAAATTDTSNTGQDQTTDTSNTNQLTTVPSMVTALTTDSTGDQIVPAEPANPGDSTTISINYEGNPNSQQINYTYNGSPAKDKNGNPIGPEYAGVPDPTKPAGTGNEPTSRSGDTVNTPIPAGWKPVEQSDGQTTLTPGEDGTVTPKTVEIEHDQYTTPSTGCTAKAGDQIPGTDDSRPTDSSNTFAQDMTDLTQVEIDRSVHYDLSGVGAATKTELGSNTPIDYSDSINATRSAVVDTVDGTVNSNSYGPWQPSGSFGNYTVKQIAGYDAIVTDQNGNTVTLTGGQIAGQSLTSDDIEGLGASVDGKRTWKIYTVTYKAQSGNQAIHFVGADGNNLPATDDKDANGNTIIDTTVTGTVDQAATDLNSKIPAGWVLADPNTQVMISNDAQAIPVNVAIKHGQVESNAAKSYKQGDKLPSGATVQSDASDLTRDLTRTVTITDPHNGPSTTTQSLHFTRTATIDAVTGDVTYNLWTPTDGSAISFAAVTVPTVDGYTASGTVAQVTPSQDNITSNNVANVNISYTANAAHQDFTYVDQDDNNETVFSDTETGQTDGTITPKLPTGFDVVSAKTADGTDVTADFKNGTLKFKPDNQTKTITVTVTEHHDTISPTDTTPGDETDSSKQKGAPADPNDPNGPKLDNPVDYNALHRTITQIVYQDDETGKVANTDTQNLYFERTADINRATGHVAYTNWQAVKSLAEGLDTGNTQGAATGFTAVSIAPKDGYSFLLDGNPSADGEVAATNYDLSQDSGQNAVTGSAEDALTQTITHTLSYQAVQNTITYEFVDDDEGGKVVTASVDGKTQIGNNGVITFTGDTATSENADAIKQAGLVVPDDYDLAQGTDNAATGDYYEIPTEIDFKGPQTNGTMPRKIHLVHHTTAANDPNNIPAGAKDANGNAVTQNDFSTNVTRHISVDLPVAGDVTVDSSGKQTIPTKTVDASQTITLKRTGVYDEVTGIIAWNPWQLGKFSALDLNQLAQGNGTSILGFTPNTTVPEMDNVGADYDNSKNPIQITFTANKETQTIHYVDENGAALPAGTVDAGGNTVKDTAISGVTHQQIATVVPDGWVLVNSSDASLEIPAPDSNGTVPPRVVEIKHGTIIVSHTTPHNQGDPVDPTKPNGTKYGDGFAKNEVETVAQRQITITLPADVQSTDFAGYTPGTTVKLDTDQSLTVTAPGTHEVILTQTVYYYRDPIMDAVTGTLVGYKQQGNSDSEGWYTGDTDREFKALPLPQFAGYTAHITAGTPEQITSKFGVTRMIMPYMVMYLADAKAKTPDTGNTGSGEIQSGSAQLGKTNQSDTNKPTTGNPASGSGNSASGSGNSADTNSSANTVANNQQQIPAAPANPDENGTANNVVNNIIDHGIEQTKKHVKSKHVNSKHVNAAAGSINGQNGSPRTDQANFSGISSRDHVAVNSMNSNTTGAVNKQAAANSQTRENALPQTGAKNSQTYAYIVLGITAIIAAIGLAGAKRKR